MKIQASFIFSLLSLPLLVTCNNEIAMSTLHEALVVSRHLHSSASHDFAAMADFFDGTKNKDHEADNAYDDPAPLFHERVLRDLQFTDACNVAYYELWEDQALNEAATAYSTSYDEAVATSCVDDSSTNIKCVVDGPIQGETEYQSACAAAGGETIPMTFGLSCDGTFEGQPTSIIVDLPPILSCVPASDNFDSCADDIRNLFQNYTDLLAFAYEYGLSSGGYSQVSCSGGEAGDGGADNGGSSNADGNGGSSNAVGIGGSSNASTKGIVISSFLAMFGSALIMMVHYL